MRKGMFVRMKILIAGDGKLGEKLSRQLSSEGHEITLVDSNPSVLESSVNRYDVMATAGNCAAMDVLREAGVEKANLLIAATGSDEVNLLCCTTAHWINPGLHTIARIRNPEYAEQAYAMRDAFAISMTVNPDLQAAIEIERLLKYPGFLKRDTFAKGRMEIVELRLDAGSKLCNVSLSGLNALVKCKILVCAVLRDGVSMIPDGNFVLREGDRIFVTAPTDALSVLLKNLGIMTRKVQRVMIVGGGKISYYLADALRKSHIDVQLIERDEERCLMFADQLPGISVIRGDASELSLLESHGLSSSSALVALTGLDELNIVLSLYGKRNNVPQVIAKVSRMTDTSVIDSLALGSMISPENLCCSSIVRYVRAVQNQIGAAITVHSIADGKAEATEFRIDEDTPHCDEPLKNLRLRENVLIVGISRGNMTEIPNGDSCYHVGDTVVIVSSGNGVIGHFGDIFA